MYAIVNRDGGPCLETCEFLEEAVEAARIPTEAIVNVWNDVTVGEFISRLEVETFAVDLDKWVH